MVILADPTDRVTFRPDVHLSRSEDGSARGFLRVTEASSGWSAPADLARPLGWSDREEEERRFEAAEEVRLLYVAVTRAREELVVARWPDGRGSSAWEPLDPWLEENAEILPMEIDEPLEREGVDLTPAAVETALREAGAAVASAARPTYRHLTVTELAKGRTANGRGIGGTGGADTGGTELRGFSWGSAVHGALAAAAGDPPRETLRAACRNLLVESQRPLDDHGEPEELTELLDLVASVQASELWARARSAERFLAEVPFSLPDVELEDPAIARDNGEAAGPSRDATGGRGRRQLDLFAAPDELGASTAGQGSGEGAENGPEPRDGCADAVAGSGAPGRGRGILEGVIDLAFKEDGGWVIADYKTDVGTDPDFPARADAYRRQVDLYAEAWSRLTGEPIKERVLFFTAQKRIESW